MTEHDRWDDARDKAAPSKRWGPYVNDFSPDQGRSRAAMPLFATIKPEAVLEGGNEADFETRAREASAAPTGTGQPAFTQPSQC
jgi:hypothetical protein